MWDRTMGEEKRKWAKHANKLLGRYKIEVEEKKSTNIKSLYNKQTLTAIEHQICRVEKEAKRK